MSPIPQILVAVLAQQRACHCFGCYHNHCVSSTTTPTSTTAMFYHSLATTPICEDTDGICCNYHHCICPYYHHCCCFNGLRSQPSRPAHLLAVAPATLHRARRPVLRVSRLPAFCAPVSRVPGLELACARTNTRSATFVPLHTIQTSVATEDTN